MGNGVTQSRLSFRENFISFITIMPDDPNHEEEEEEEEEDNFQLTDDQVADFRDAFKKFDAAGEGEIPTSELGTVMKMLGHKLNDDELEECIKMVDADGGGSVDIDEFMELMRTKTKRLRMKSKSRRPSEFWTRKAKEKSILMSSRRSSLNWM